LAGSIRLFVKFALQADAVVPATPGQAHYLANVMRRSVGDEVRLFNGRDGEWTARITGLRKDRGSFAVLVRVREQAPEPDTWLMFAPLRNTATELVVQKATELGCDRIMPVKTERTNAPNLNIARLTAIAIEAAEQCERLTIPEITPVMALKVVLVAWPFDGGRPIHAAIERSDAPPLRRIEPRAALLVGPEGGFSAAELDDMAAYSFVHPASLGPRILRAETAAIAGLALLQAHTVD
jgi:16S rRNA (uracil1498-N3)-methyltransferase